MMGYSKKPSRYYKPSPPKAEDGHVPAALTKTDEDLRGLMLGIYSPGRPTTLKHLASRGGPKRVVSRKVPPGGPVASRVKPEAHKTREPKADDAQDRVRLRLLKLQPWSRRQD
jgi:hypothetical protein